MKGALLLVVLALAVACSSPRRGEPLAGLLEPENSAVRDGREVYMERCHKCHPGGEAGLGPSLNDKPLPRFLMKLQVRRGFGAMPSFDDHQIPDEDLDDLLDFVVALRRHDRSDS